VDVVVLRWPEDRDRRDALHRAGYPRLLVVEEGAAPPPVADDLEDWIRLPDSEVDRQARLDALRRRASGRVEAEPELVDGILRVEESWVSLPPVEARLAGALLARFGTVVSREALAHAGWPSGLPGRNALDVHMVRLRRRLASVRLVIRTVRSRGYLLERAQPQ